MGEGVVKFIIQQLTEFVYTVVLCGGEELVAMLRISLFEAPAVGVEVAGKDLSHAFTRPVLIASSNLEQK